MSILNFSYSMRLFYSEMVEVCHFTFKCVPKNTKRQKLIQLNIEMEPKAKYSYSEDSFNNKKIIGSVDSPHNYFYLDVSGLMDVSSIGYEEDEDESVLGIYRYPYGKTIPGNLIRKYTEKLVSECNTNGTTDDYDKALFVMSRLGEDYSYNSGFTDISTTAEDAFALKNGVCQDFSHIYISIIKLMYIPARYVTGFMLGEGKSHAWVEFYYQNRWIGIDPTNRNMIDENYIKLGHGRDADDCQINLGIMRGGGSQRQEIDVKVWKEQLDD